MCLITVRGLGRECAGPCPSRGARRAPVHRGVPAPGCRLGPAPAAGWGCVRGAAPAGRRFRFRRSRGGGRAGGWAGEEPPEPEFALWRRAALGPGEQGARGDRASGGRSRAGARAGAGPGRAEAEAEAEAAAGGGGPRRAGVGGGEAEEAEAWRPGRGAMAAAETKIIYHLDEQETPYLVKLPIPAERVTLGDFKGLLNRPNYKFYFKSMDDDFG